MKDFYHRLSDPVDAKNAMNFVEATPEYKREMI
jgi:hypothetical protein